MAATSSFTLTLLVGFLCCSLSLNTEQVPCYTSEKSPYRLYGSKTAYEEIPANWNGSVTRNTDSVEQGCNPIMIWHLNRHGYRYPGDDDIELFNTVLPVFRDGIVNNATVAGQFCAGDLAALRDWTPRMVPRDDSKLVETGHRELMSIADHFRGKYPSLLNVSVDALLANFTFRHTDKERTRMSAKAFVKGLLKQPGMSDAELNALVDRVPMVVREIGKDLLLRFYDVCEKYIKTVDEQPVAELEKFYKASVMAKTRGDVSMRLGLDQSLNETVAEALWLACASEYAIYGLTQDKTVRNSSAAPWCSLFTQEELKAFEYVADLEYYYKNSYGNEVNYEQTCPLLKDLIGAIRNATTGSNFLHGLFRFAHSATIVPFYSALGLFKDAQAPTSDNYDSRADRKLRTSYIDSMASNINFVIYKCEDTHKFKIHVNERETLLPGCSDILCDVSILMDSVGKVADACDFEKICKWPVNPPIGRATRDAVATTTLMLTFLVLLLSRQL
ncbi:multiple inositol polyphosphate phosphatase 1 [Lingula anatina]|uniref:Multiple inositol polyphosphate phosphatase 1 n=1 Tax=Lingula anatina TaxID=7574 RepID=A0A1S3K5S7_LINAN|nr:multiple inositol polyphosphate phosphatase 1 [Lingula anatina]|eukprot:XP_013417862.1 multiple inositol polyphosphate phosphatase 1 [Lingula anatina]